MTDRQYHNRLFALTAELARAASARPYDPDAYNAVIDELNALSRVPIRSRRRPNWLFILIVLVYLLALAIVVYGIVRPL